MNHHSPARCASEKIFPSLRAGLLAFAFFIFLISAAQINAATLTVTNTDDSGAGSLRQSIADAADGDTITFDPTFFNTQRNIDLTGAELDISKNLTITGPGARLLTVRRAIGNPTGFRVFYLSNSTINFSGMTISNGEESGIFASLVTLTLNGVVVSGNSANAGGGINHVYGKLTILNSTISGNTSVGEGAGISIRSVTADIANTTISGNTSNTNINGSGGIGLTRSTLNMNNVTITGNSVVGTDTNRAGGVAARGGTVNIRNSIISGNSAEGNTSPDVRGVFVSNGSNLIGDPTGSTGFGAAGDKLNVAAMLGELMDNGGQSDTHRLLPGSPALDAGDNCVMTVSCAANNPPVALTSDQRGAGFTRQQGAAIEIGAVEILAPTAAEISISGRVLTGSGRGLTGAFVILTDQSGTARMARTRAFGYYRFDNVAAGGTIVLSVASKRYQYAPQVISPTQNLSEINLIAAPSDNILLKAVKPKK